MHKTVRIDPNSYSVLKEALSVNPLGREILPTLESQARDIPVYSLKASELQPPIKMDVNEIESSALFSIFSTLERLKSTTIALSQRVLKFRRKFTQVPRKLSILTDFRLR